MNKSDNFFLYQSDGEIIKDEMYIISDDVNIHTEDLPSGSENIIQVAADSELTDINGESYILYDENGQAYIVESNSSETNSDVNSINGKLITYRCPSCTVSYQNANAFTKHMREKHFVKVFTCRQCEQFFENLSLLFLHARRTHVDPKKPRKNPHNFKFHCPDCDYMTNNGGTMEHHRRAHSGVKPYQCDICLKMFAQKANMKTHKNRHIHKDRIFRCDTCNKSFNSHDIYLAHLRTREHELQEHFQMIITSKIQIRCLGCNEMFDNYFYVNKHSRSCDILRSLDVKFWCVQCDTGFTGSSSLKHHLKGHGGNQIISCPVCGERGFPGFNQLNHHITRAHALKVNRRNVCRYCEMTFENKDLLDDHIDSMHHSERNARQSRGAAGRLRCQFDGCDFTSNSVMLMDCHIDKHLNNSLSLTTPTVSANQGGRKRKSTVPVPVVTMEINDDENWQEEYDINNNSSNNRDDDDDGVCPENHLSSVSVESPEKIDLSKVNDQENFDELDIEDLERLASSFVEDPESPPTKIDLTTITATNTVTKKRGRVRKIPVKFDDYEVSDLEALRAFKPSSVSEKKV